jgi:prepilin-type N-terminal cleavage/methylation domain-containing protein
MKRRNCGFTLPELLVGLSIAAVMAGMAAPSLQEMARNARVTAAQDDLLGALAYERGQAARRAMPVAVCGSADQRSCSATTDWASGWIAFTDAAGEPGVVDGTDTVLRAWQGPGATIDVRSSAPVSPEWVRFSAAGHALPARVTKRFDIQPAGCATSPSPRMQLWVEPAGSIRHERGRCT